jgi:hypothetical protein
VELHVPDDDSKEKTNLNANKSNNHILLDPEFREKQMHYRWRLEKATNFHLGSQYTPIDIPGDLALHT